MRAEDVDNGRVLPWDALGPEFSTAEMFYDLYL